MKTVYTLLIGLLCLTNLPASAADKCALPEGYSNFTDKEKTYVGLNAVMCRYLSHEVFIKNMLPANENKVTNSAIYNAINKIYGALGTSNINSSESKKDLGTGCFDYGPFLEKNLQKGAELYFAKMLNSCMVRAGGDFKKTYCVDLTKGVKSHRDFQKGIVGLLRKASIITQSEAQAYLK